MRGEAAATKFVFAVLAAGAWGCEGSADQRRSADDPATGGDAASPTNGADGANGADGSPPNSGDGGEGPGGKPELGCRPLVHEAGVDFGGLKSDTYAWSDAACEPRTAGLVQSDAPGGGGFARGFTYRLQNRTRSAMGSDVDGWNGFGYLVNHGTPTTTSRGLGGTYRVVLAGAHHAIHEFKTRMQLAGPVDVTVHWFFATGHSNPIFAITHDSSPSGEGVVNSDSRSPYGDIQWDEGPDTDHHVDGVAWGDKYQFTSLGDGPLTPASEWDYTQPNVIPYAMAWANEADAEMGLVQTQTFDQLPAGGDYGSGTLEADCWGRTHATKGPSCSSDWTLPQNWLWPVQLNQYELPSTTASHRVAWGSTYGAVGAREYRAFGKTLSGYPYYSYSVAVVLGTHSGKSVETQRKDFEATHSSRLMASRGEVLATGPAGVGRSDSVTYAPAGYNHVYGTWELRAANSAITAALSVDAGSLSKPIFRVHGFTAEKPSRVRVGGKQLVAGEGYFASVDAEAQLLWLTVNHTLSGTVSLEIE